MKIELLDSERTVCEVWSRVMGYHRPVVEWNIGKKGEWGERRFFTEKAGKLNSGMPLMGPAM